MPADLTDFEPAEASPVAVKSPVSKSRQDLGDFEPVDELTDEQKQGLNQLNAATFGPGSMIAHAQRMNAVDDYLTERDEKAKASAAVVNDPFAAFNATLKGAPATAQMPEVTLPDQPAGANVTSPIQPVAPVTTESALPTAQEVPSHGVYATETPTVINNIREGKFDDAASLAMENVMGSKPLRFLFGPTERQKIAESVPVKKDDGTTGYEFKPASTDAVEKLGAVGAARRSVSALERGIPVMELDKAVEGEMYKENPKDSTIKSIGKGLYNAIHRTVITFSDPTMALIPESRLISGGFTLDMAHSAQEQIQKGLESDTPQGAIEGLLGGVVTLGMAGMSGSHTLKPTKADIIQHMDTVPDELLHEAKKELKTSAPDVASAAGAELMKRAVDFGQEMDTVLKRLPGDVQEKVNGILQKQLAGEELTGNERATLLQVRSYASKVAAEQSNAEFTSGPKPPTAPTPPAEPVAPTGTGGQSVSPRIEPAPDVADSQLPVPPVVAKVAAAVEPLRAAADAAAETSPEAAQAAREQADLLEKRAQAQAGTRIAGPAITDAEGKIIAQGEVGSRHADLKRDEILKGNADAADAEHRFVDDKGNVLDRQQAWDLAEKTGQIAPETLAAQKAGAIGKELHSQHLLENERPESVTPEPTPPAEPISEPPPVAASPEPVERPPSEIPAAPEAPVGKSGSLLDKLESLLTEEEPPVAAEAPQSAAERKQPVADAALQEFRRLSKSDKTGNTEAERELANVFKDGGAIVDDYPRILETALKDLGTPEAEIDRARQAVEKAIGDYYQKLPKKEMGKVQRSQRAQVSGPNFGPSKAEYADYERANDIPPPSPAENRAQKRVSDIQRDIENNANAEPAWKRRRQKDLKEAQKALAKEQEVAPAPAETVAEPAPTESTEKETWQKTRDEIKEEGSSLTKHRTQTRAAVERGENVPLEVLESYSGYHWADKMRKEKYGEQVSDSFLTKIIDSLKDENGNLHFDPLFIQSVGKPALRGAIKLIREAVDAGGLAKDVMADVLQYIKAHTDTFDEAKTREFFQPVIDEALGGKAAPAEEVAPPTEQPAPTKDTAPVEPPTPEPPITDSRMTGEDGESKTGTANAIVDRERQRRGEPPILSEAKKALGDTWDEATKAFDDNKDVGVDLVQELNKKPRAITAKEEAILLREKVDVMNDLAKATETAINESAAPEDRAASRVRAAVLMDQLNAIDEATRRAGTEWGRTGRFRQMLAAEDYSLSRMLQKSELAKQRPLTPEEQAQVKVMSDRIASLEKQLADFESNHAQEVERIRNEEADKAIAKMQKDSTPVLKVARRIVEKWKAEADQARASMGSLFGAEGGGVGGVGGGKGGGRKLGQQEKVEQSRITALAKIIRAEIAETTLDLAEVTTKLVGQFGERVAPYIDRAWAAANNLIEKEDGAARAIRQARAVKSKDPAEQRQNIVNRIAEKRKDGAREAIGSSIQQLAESFVRSGIYEREPLIDAVHAAVKEALPEASRKDIRDAISGYGDYKELSKDEAKVILRDLKGQMQQISKLEDMIQNRRLPARTGVERRTQSAEERQLLKEVNKIKKELGLETTDPTQLKGALDAAKTRARNRIEDLQRAIEKKEKIPQSDKALKEDAELRDLNQQKAALQEEYKAMFGKAKPTAEEIAADEAQKAVDRAAAALDRQQRINSGEIKPEPNEKAQPLSQLEKELRDRTEALREAKRKADAIRSPEDVAAEKAQKGVDAAAAAVDRWDQILKGEMDRNPGAVKEPLSNLEEELRAQADAMRQAADELRRQPKSEDAKRAAEEEAQIKALEKSLADYERKLKAMDFSGKGKAQTRPEVERVAKARAARDAAKKAYDDLKKAQIPKRTPDEIALAAYKARTKTRIEELNDRTKRGDFSKKVRKPVELDPEGVKLRADAARAKLEFDRAVYHDKQKNMSKAEKVLDVIPKIARMNLLSNPVTFAKLFAAALWRISATPVQEVIGGGLGKLPYVSEVAARAPREGGLNTKAEAKALTEALTKGMRDAWHKATKGETELDLAYGKPSAAPHTWMDIFGNFHGAMKAPAVRAEFARSFEKFSTSAAANGVDITEPAVQLRLGIEAYREAQRAIFQNDNRVVQIWNTAMRQLEQPSKVTGRVSLRNKAIQSVAKTVFPIVKIPTNIVAEAFEYATGTVTGSVRLAQAFRRGVETLKPEEADLIMRELKRGSFGAAVMLLGFLASQSVGGFYQPGQRRRDDDVKPGTVRMFGLTVPSYLLHNPMVEQLQVGATIGRVANSKLRKKDHETQGIPAGILASALGLVEEVPFATGAEQLHKLFTPNEREEYLGELARSRVEPQFIQWMAQQADKGTPFSPFESPRQRKPEDITEEMEMGLPGLRQNVPLRRKRSWR